MRLEAQPFQSEHGSDASPGNTEYNQPFSSSVRQGLDIIISVIYDSTAGSQHDVTPTDQFFSIGMPVPDFGAMFPGTGVFRFEVGTADVIRSE